MWQMELASKGSIKVLLWTKRCITPRSQRKHPARNNVCSSASVAGGVQCAD